MRARTFYILLAVAWFGCGFIGSGFGFADLQRSNPDFAQDNYAENTKLFWIGVIAGPSTFASLALDSGYKKGFQIPGPEARSEATRLQTRARRNW